MIWSPGPTWRTSPRTISSGVTSTSRPSRTTVTVLRLSSCNRSSLRLARISWTALMAALITPSPTLVNASL
jgi:hypothetical protein